MWCDNCIGFDCILYWYNNNNNYYEFIIIILFISLYGVVDGLTWVGWAFAESEQVFENYGQPNHIYFMYHGFSLEGNSHDCVLVDWGLSENEFAAVNWTSSKKILSVIMHMNYTWNRHNVQSIDLQTLSVEFNYHFRTLSIVVTSQCRVCRVRHAFYGQSCLNASEHFGTFWCVPIWMFWCVPIWMSQKLRATPDRLRVGQGGGIVCLSIPIPDLAWLILRFKVSSCFQGCEID